MERKNDFILVDVHSAQEYEQEHIIGALNVPVYRDPDTSAYYGIYVKELAIGWNEWRYDWNMWNYPHEWETTNVEDYIYSGKELGSYSGLDSLGKGGCSLSESFNC
jgi:hypothetical protein